MSNYTQVNLFLTKGQKEKIIREFKKGDTKISIKLTFTNLKKTGNTPFLLNSRQVNKMKKGIKEKKGVVLNLSKAQINKMMKSGAGFFDVIGKVWDSTNVMRKGFNAGIRNPILKAVGRKDLANKKGIDDYVFGSSVPQRIKPAYEINNIINQIKKKAKKKPLGKGLNPTGHQQY